MDILTGCTGSIAAEVVKCTAKPVIRHVGYLFRFKKTVDDLTKAKTDLQLEQQKVQEAIQRAAMNTEVVEKDVERWLANVNQLLEEVQALENKVQVNLRFCNGWCPDWIRQYKFCKEAIQKTHIVKELQANKGKFSELTHRAPTPGIEIFSSSDFKVFESRNLAFQQIMEALHEDNNKGIGLYGMGGIGKTTLVKEVYKKVKELSIFNDIVMIVVSRTPDVRRIQGEIADCLHLKLEEESDTARANRICERIKNVEKILIILDDVWRDVNLEAIGIPSCDDHRGCKMLLTTRSVHVCNLMRCQRKIPLNILVEEESLVLMKKIAIVDDCAVLNDVVLKVVQECKGLPIAIITVGKALIGKSLDDWNAAMHRLRKSRLVDIEGVDEEKNAYACLKWSYDQLKCKTKLCFLLCSLLPEDYNIPIEELTRYAMGLEEDEDFQSLDEARSQVHAAINSLKDSSLLLEGSKKEFVKMHDMVRDVGLWITSKGKNEFELRACTRLERNTNLERATAISLIDYNTEQLPDNLVCPRLNILLLGRIRSSKEISNALFEGMNCLKVLTLHGKILSSQSLKLLTNLRTLYLEGCNFSDDLSSLGKLKRLETLSFNRCRMVALPSELGEMASLKMLDLSNCYRLKWIPPNVIQSLSKLEELIIERSFNNWDVEGPTSKKSNGSFKNWNVGMITSKKSNAKLSELNFLPRLVILSTELNSEHLPKGFVFPDLQRYCISLDGQQLNPFSMQERELCLFFQERNTNLRCINSSILEIKNWDASSINAFKLLFHTVKYLRIQCCDTKCIADTTGGNDQYISFSNLVELHLWKMRRLRKICEGPNQYVSFSNLTVLVARGCPRLISLFSPSLAQSLKKLKELTLDQCHEMKQIISEEGMILESHGQPICLSKLETLEVEKCGKLEYIFPISVARGLQQLERLNLQDLPRLKKVFGQEREGEVGDCEIESHHQPTGFPKLTTIEVVNCENLECLSIARDLPQLESLSLQDLPQLKQVFGQNREREVGDCEIESHHQPTGFPKLTTIKVVNCENLECLSIARDLPQLESLSLQDLPQLKQVFGQNKEGEVGDGNNNMQLESHHQRTGFPKLKTIEVVNCENLECLSIARDLPQLKKLSLYDLPQLKKVFGYEKGGDDGDGNNSVLSKLRNLRLWNLPELVSFGGGNSSSVWPSLESLYMVNCPKVKLSFFANVEANVPALQKLQNLQILPVDDWNAISFDLMQGLSNLEELYIKNCGGIQEVIKLEGLLTIKGEQDLLLPRLKKMYVVDLHELRCIWKGATKLINLNNLEDLKVIGCKKLMHLFTPALAQSLQKLKFLEIERCDELEHLIVENAEEHVSSESHLQPSCFPKPNVVKVKVKGCNKLKCLFHVDRWNLVSSFLTFEELEINNCGGFQEVFNFEGLLTREGEQQDEFFPRLRRMCLVNLDELTYIWKGPIQLVNLNSLENLEVIGCKKLVHLFTPVLFQSLQKLKNLKIARCDKLEHLIVENVEEQVSSESHLQPLCFPKLERVNVRYCNKLKNLFPMTIANSLVELRIFLVKENPQLMEVFTHEGDARVQKDVTLPQLVSMGLKGLPSLVNFCPKNYQFILPKVWYLRVESCKKMRTTFTRTPDRSVLINGEVAQIDEPTGTSTISPVLAGCPANNDITWTDFDRKRDNKSKDDNAWQRLGWKEMLNL